MVILYAPLAIWNLEQPSSLFIQITFPTTTSSSIRIPRTSLRETLFKEVIAKGWSASKFYIFILSLTSILLFFYCLIWQSLNETNDIRHCFKSPYADCNRSKVDEWSGLYTPKHIHSAWIGFFKQVDIDVGCTSIGNFSHVCQAGDYSSKGHLSYLSFSP